MVQCTSKWPRSECCGSCAAHTNWVCDCSGCWNKKKTKERKHQWIKWKRKQVNGEKFFFFFLFFSTFSFRFGWQSLCKIMEGEKHRKGTKKKQEKKRKTTEKIHRSLQTFLSCSYHKRVSHFHWCVVCIHRIC